jgi:hypothetical protein
MAKLPGVELLYIREPHLAGKEVFGFQKRKPMFLSVFKASYTGRTK